MKAKEYKLHSKIEERISDRCKDTMSKLLEPNPLIRLSATQTIDHKWLDPTFTSDKRIK